jgi:hypothetical protein
MAAVFLLSIEQDVTVPCRYLKLLLRQPSFVRNTFLFNSILPQCDL